MANKKAEILTMDGQVVSPITLATNVLLDDGRTAQVLLDSRDESMFSPTITTSSSISKVGQGDNVDFSENVIDGAYKSCVLKGKTLVNYNAEGNDRNEYVCMPSVEGSNLTVNGTVEGKVKSAILSGQTLVNIAPNMTQSSLTAGTRPWKFSGSGMVVGSVSDNKLKISTTIDGSMIVSGEVPNTMKPSTKYYVQVEVKNNSNHNLYFYKVSTQSINLTTGLNKFIITTVGDFNVNHMGIAMGNSGSVKSGTEFEFSNLMIIEYQDGMENWDIPYFTGMQSVKLPVLTTTGKNLFDGEIELGGFYGSTGLPFNSNDRIRSKNKTLLRKGTYTLSCENAEYVIFSIWSLDGKYIREHSIKNKINTYTFDTDALVNICVLGGDLLGSKILLEENTVATSFEPYKSNILTVNEDVELGSVGEVKDELNLLTGQLTQRTETRAYQEGDESNSEVITDMANTRYKLPKESIKTVDLSDNHIYSYKDTTHYDCSSAEGSLLPTLTIEEGVRYEVIIKPSTKYSIVFNRTEVASGLTVDLGGATANIVSATLGKNIVQITTPPTLSHNYVIFKGLGNVIKDVQVIEGDVVGDEPYFEGVCDVDMPVLKTTGKNLVKDNRYTLDCGSGVALNGCRNTVIAKNIKVKPNTKYVFSYGKTVNIPSGTRLKVMTLTDVVNEDVHVNVYLHKNRIKEHSLLNGEMFTTESNARYISITTGNFTTTGDILIEDIQLEQGTQATPYEPYKSNILSFNQKDDKTIVLRSLPNGVCDTLNVETGEYVQRIGDYTVNGTETSWFTYIDTTGVNNNYLNQTSCAFGVHLTGKAKGNGILCDKLPTRSIGWWGGNHTGEGICGIDNDNRIFLRVKNEKTGVLYTDNTSTALEKVKTYLASNPVTVQYELATPIVSTIDVQGFPYAYTSGHVQLSSGHSGQSLTPTIEYSLIANRLGQIQSNQKLVEKQQAQIDELESMVIANLVNTQYQQALNEIKLGVK